MSKIGKVLLSTAMIAATAATFASTTYAFVVLEKEAHVDNIDFQIETHEGLLVSLDADQYVDSGNQDVVIEDLANIGANKLKAKNFYQDISSDMLKDKKVLGTKYQGVTMLADEEKKHTCTDKELTDAFGVKFDQLGNIQFVKDKLVANEKTPNNPYDSKHEFSDPAVAATDYVKLDFSFRLAHQGEISGDYKLVFKTSSITSALGHKDSIELLNSLTTVGKNPNNKAKIEVGNEQNVWNAGETFSVDPVDALRVAIVNRDEYVKKLSSDPSAALTVLESKNGHGSAAIEGITSEEPANPSVYDKAYNAMYTYHNNVHPFEPFTEAAVQNCSFDTEKVDFSNFTAGDTSYELGTFTAKTVEAEEGTKTVYDDLHLTMYIYLEGWDADFFTGISHKASDFIVNLGFAIEKVQPLA